MHILRFPGSKTTISFLPLESGGLFLASELALDLFSPNEKGELDVVYTVAHGFFFTEEERKNVR